MSQIAPTRSGHVVIGVDTHKHIHVAAVMVSRPLHSVRTFCESSVSI